MFFLGGNPRAPRAASIPIRSTTPSPAGRSTRPTHIVYLENEYVRIGILPEIGGRHLRGRGQDQQLQLHLSPARHQAGADRPDRRVDFRRRRVEHPAPSPRQHLPARCSTASRRTPTAARPSGWANWNCASACAGPWATRCGRASPYLEALGPHPQPHARGQHHALLRQRGGARQRQLPGHLPAGHAVRAPTTPSASSPTGRSPPAVTAAPTSARAST